MVNGIKAGTILLILRSKKLTIKSLKLVFLLAAKDEVIGHHEQALKAKDDLITHYENIINSLDKSAQIKMLRKLGLLKKKPS